WRISRPSPCCGRSAVTWPWAVLSPAPWPTMRSPPGSNAGRRASAERPAMDDARILEAWRANAAPWTDAVRAGRIASRRQVTDRAIIDAVSAQRPHTVLDVGCGEGWLARALATRGMTVTGIDAVPALVEQARAGG